MLQLEKLAPEGGNGGCCFERHGEYAFVSSIGGSEGAEFIRLYAAIAGYDASVL